MVKMDAIGGGIFPEIPTSDVGFEMDKLPM